jgi:hypothetical protein
MGQRKFTLAPTGRPYPYAGPQGDRGDGTTTALRTRRTQRTCTPALTSQRKLTLAPTGRPYTYAGPQGA